MPHLLEPHLGTFSVSGMTEELRTTEVGSPSDLGGMLSAIARGPAGNGVSWDAGNPPVDESWIWILLDLNWTQCSGWIIKEQQR